MSLNKVMLIGNIGREPESRQVGDRSVIKFSLATTEKYTDRNGQQVENTEWHNIEYWVKNTAILQYLHSGTQVFVEGQIRTDSWDGNDGQKHYATIIRISSLQLLGGKPQNQQGNGYQQQSQPQQYQQPAPQNNGYQQGYQQPYQGAPQNNPQGFQQTGQFPQQPVNQPQYPQQGQTRLP